MPDGLATVIHFILKGKAKNIGVNWLVQLDPEDATAIAILKPFFTGDCMPQQAAQCRNRHTAQSRTAGSDV